MTQSVDYRTCRSCGKVIQKTIPLIQKFPQLFKLPEPQPDPYRWATADAAEVTSCGTAGEEALSAHTPAAPTECVRKSDGGQCVNYAADYPNGPNKHACRALPPPGRRGPSSAACGLAARRTAAGRRR